MTDYTVLATANPNRHGRIELRKYAEDDWAVKCAWEEDTWDFDTEAQAREAFDAEVKRLADTPNWEAQAEYDAEHGTINGYAEWQYNREY